MRITRLYLRNYRVYEDPVDLEMPAGLVGIYGLNGSGKSTLVESVLWTLFGRARTAKDEIRTAGVLGDCVTELELEHEGHLYRFRRVIAGQAAAVRAQAHCDGLQVAEGVTDTRSYVESVLGMDDASFRASVFAEQNQLSAFSGHAPHERRKLVLGLLGVAPLDTARDQSRRDAKAAREALERLRAVLSDLDQLGERLASAEAAAAAATAEAADGAAAEAAAREVLDQVEAEYEALGALAAEHDALVRDAQARRDELQRATRRIQALRGEEKAMDEARTRLGQLSGRSGDLSGVDDRLRLARTVVEAGRALADLGPLVEVAPPDPQPADRARELVYADRTRLSDLDGELRAVQAERDRAGEAVDRAGELSGEGCCPLCGQHLGQAFGQVQAHRAAELAGAEQRLAALVEERAALAAVAAASTQASGRQDTALRHAQEAWDAYRQLAERRADARARLDGALAAAGSGGLAAVEPDGEPAGAAAAVAQAWAHLVQELAAEAEDRRRAAQECERLWGRLERAASVTAELAEELARERHARDEIGVLRDKVRALGFRTEDLERGRSARSRAKGDMDAAAGRARAAELAAAQARGAAEAAADALEVARRQHLKAEQMAGDARHLGRAADLLSGFRDTVVAGIGPRLSAQAADLFGELTDHEYDRLEVDPDTFEIQLGDQGVLYKMGRFSGSETDLANLALRVAISEQVGFQSGGAVGLLVLDEVFGPLDDDRKERMLGALERLRARFRQILVITHAGDIKEQLPSAIEVAKLPGRRATARLV